MIPLLQSLSILLVPFVVAGKWVNEKWNDNCLVQKWRTLPGVVQNCGDLNKPFHSTQWKAVEITSSIHKIVKYERVHLDTDVTAIEGAIRCETYWLIPKFGVFEIRRGREQTFPTYVEAEQYAQTTFGPVYGREYAIMSVA